MILEKQFKGKFKISFEPFLQKKECLINANEMANAFDKQVRDYLKSEKTQAFILVLENELGNKKHEHKNVSQEDVRLLEKGNYVCNVDGEEKEISENIIKLKYGGSNNGTWLHRHLAIDFAMWLDPYFKFWMISCIDEILFRHTKIQDACLKEKMILNKEKKELKDGGLVTLEDYKRFFDIEQRLAALKSTSSSATREKIKEWKLDLFGDESEGVI